MKSIIFNTEAEIQAILGGTKTQMRRVIKFADRMTGHLPERTPEENEKPYIYYPCGIKRPKYQIGDMVYVRETWCKLYDLDGNENIIEGTGKYYYVADNPKFPYTHFLRDDGTYKDYAK